MSDALRQGLRTTTEGARGLARVFQGFKDFVSRGNAIELAVGVVIGAAFGGVITAIQDGLIAPLIAMIFGQPDISDIWVIGAKGEAKINMGLMLNALLQFLITAAAIYFLIVLPLNALAERRKRGIEAEPERPSEDILLLQEIRDLLAAQSTPALRSDTGQVPPAGPTGPTGPAAPGAPGRPPVA
ncbi:large conductance mechanosensitive channel protein MscL [Cellulomonas hominis]|uniref:large conductance mechanosensitive channel protein MscL n=1 Tax=Cellulomonas hominis TaxID=156981 RepID=UPI001C11EABB|nr:large conductance mechanosensitive channel protein MscL [Cellulomonas hominis]MBU5423399.1 large conductance mechanosensitive channel protein MscL [Cellulomonas hominis]